MSKLKLGAIADDKPVRVTHDLPPVVHRDLVAYAEALARETGAVVEPVKLIAPMLERFMDRSRVLQSTKDTASRASYDDGCVARRSAARRRAELRKRLNPGLSFDCDQTRLNGISSWSRGRNATPG